MMSEGTSHQKKFKPCSSDRCIYAAVGDLDVCYKHGAPKPTKKLPVKTTKAHKYG
jgi:hypothetical protein